MTGFSSSWVRERKPNAPERIRENVRAQKPLKPRIDSTMNKIHLQNQKLDTTLEKLKGKEKSLFNQIIVHVQKQMRLQSKESTITSQIFLWEPLAGHPDPL